MSRAIELGEDGGRWCVLGTTDLNKARVAVLGLLREQLLPGDDETFATEVEALLATCRAHVALSAYPHPDYDDALTGWHRTQIAASTQQANRPGTNRRVEVVWTNYEPHPSLLTEVTA